MLQDTLVVLIGGLIGLMLRLVGGGGSVLAVPLLVYVAGVSSAHVAIGTSALAVALGAFSNLVGAWRRNEVKWRCGLVFAAAGVVGALGGARLGKLVDASALLGLFGGMMVAVAGLMFVKRNAVGDDSVRLDVNSAARLLPSLLGGGLVVGLLSGFFGIGGGFLIVPTLVFATGMSMPYAVGTSLVSVSMFGATTAASYAQAGLVDWRIAVLFVVGTFVGSAMGSRLYMRLRASGTSTTALTTTLSAVIMAVGLYLVYQSGSALVR